MEMLSTSSHDPITTKRELFEQQAVLTVADHITSASATITCLVLFFAVGWQGRSSTAARPSSYGDATAHHSSLKTLFDPDAYAVYEALLDGPRQGGAGARIGSMAIESQTKSRELCFNPSEQRDPKLRDAATNYQAELRTRVAQSRPARPWPES
jgi:hypothetical protein